MEAGNLTKCAESTKEVTKISYDNVEYLNTNNNKQEITEPNKHIDFDHLIASAGEFGIYQVIMFMSTMPFYVFGVFSYYSQIFMTERPTEYWCWIPELSNMTADDRRAIAIPKDDSSRYGYSQCTSYVANWTTVMMTGNIPGPSWPSEKCQNGWEFDSTQIPYSTISSELGWVCDKNSYQAIAQSMFFFGSIVGGILFGWAADKYGRLPVIIASNVVGFIGGTLSVFSTSLIDFCIYRFIMGMSYDSCMMLVYLLLVEYTAPKFRTVMANVSFGLFYSAAAVALPWIALASGHWKTIALVTSLPMILAIFTPLVFLESPRWLISQDRFKEAIEKVHTIARFNKKEIPSKLIKDFEESVQGNKQESVTIGDFLKRNILRNLFIKTCIMYMLTSMVFDALVRSIGLLNFDFFISFSLVSFTEFPSLIIVAFAMDWTGRRLLVSTSMFISCIFCMLTAFLGGGLPSVICAVIARLTVNLGFNATIQWAAELMPTSVRGSAVGIIHICGSIGTVLSPYIVYLEIIDTRLPLAIVAVMSALIGAIALSLPETSKIELPQTFEDTENLVKYKSLSNICHNKSLDC